MVVSTVGLLMGQWPKIGIVQRLPVKSVEVIYRILNKSHEVVCTIHWEVYLLSQVDSQYG